MQQLNEHHSFTGMQRDMSISKQPTSFLYEGHNIRLTPRDGDTMYAITNEKGTVNTNVTISGTYLGHCLLNEYLVVFSKGSTDFITRINLRTLAKTVLFQGPLGFSLTYPIEAIGSYENENIQKVYWTDGLNQPRFINIVGDTSRYNKDSFDFTPAIELKDSISVTKILGAGEFPAGVIQYAFTYFNRYGAETNIFYTTPLLYISYSDRGGSPESKIANSFKISISNPDNKFDYLRIYSILRTSLNGTPIVKRVQDIEVHGAYTTVDSGYMSIADAIASFSIDGGATYMSIAELENATGKKIRYSVASDGTIPVPNTYTYSPVLSDYEYVFNKSDFPNLYIKNSETGNLYRVTWGDDLNNTAILYWSPTNLFCVCEYQSEGSWARGTIKKYTAKTALTYTDTGLDGESVDPTELLYKGGEEIIAKTIEQKDGTLFLGNIVVDRPHLNIEDSLLSLTEATKANPTANDTVISTTDIRYFDLVSKEPFSYLNTLSNPEGYEYAGASCFKSREYYRLGVQFQYKNGRWSEPYWIGDKQCLATPSISNNTLTLPIFQFTLNSFSILSQAYQNGYRRIRPVFAIPRGQDKTILCQGVGCPTMYRNTDRYADGSSGADGTLYAQSSWLFRVPKAWTSPIGRPDTYKASNGGGKVTADGKLVSQFDTEFYTKDDYTLEDYVIEASPMLASTEVMGLFDNDHAFRIDSNFMSIHSPETVFDDSFQNMDFKGCQLYSMGTVQLTNTYGDIDIQTSSPAIGSDVGGFIHRSIKTEGYAALVSGPFYNDYIVDDRDRTPSYGPYNTTSPPVDWPIFMWHKNGSLNNDVARSGRSAELLKKKISNYRLGGSTTYDTLTSSTDDSLNLGALDIQLFSSDELSMIKVNGHAYRGNIETMVTPTTASPFYIVGSPWRATVDTDFFSGSWYRLSLKDPNNTDSKSGVWVFEKGTHDYWSWWWDSGSRDDIGDYVKGLDQWREGISIKYKSTPHLVAQTDLYTWYNRSKGRNLSSGEMPLMEIRKTYNQDTIFGGTSDEALSAHTWIPCGPPVAFTDNTTSVTLKYKWGDSYFQRYECLKTYAFTPEDKNQVIEIASFMVESRTNIDGRYDRNRGQTSNLNVSPQNFNLLNPVYSQLDTFFNYRILDKEYYKINTFPNQITWSKEKQSGAETDTWTNITLASVYDMDGSKGGIVSLNAWKDQIFCFQTKGISNILFNSRVQIPTSDGLPIEITNSYKVDGYRYLSDGIGCNDGRMIKETPSGVYFIDSVSNHLFHIADGIGDLSVTHNMTSWFKGKGDIYKLVYDDINHDLYVLANDQALCYSEILGQFVSFIDYNGISLMETCNNRVFSLYNGTIYGMFEGNYNYFFSSYKPWWFTFISNGVDKGAMDFDKIFSTIDYRMDMKNGYTLAHDNTLNVIRVQTEYQDTGYVDLVRYKVVSNSTHLYDKTKNLEKKFRIWRIQIPRQQNSMDRIRNPWCKITLGNRNTDNTQAVLHDLNVQYFI